MSTNRILHPVLKYGRKSFLLADEQHATVQLPYPHPPGVVRRLYRPSLLQTAILLHPYDHTILMASMVPLSMQAEVFVELLSIRQVPNRTSLKDSSHAKSMNGGMRFGVVRTNVGCVDDVVLASVDVGTQVMLNMTC